MNIPENYPSRRTSPKVALSRYSVLTLCAGLLWFLAGCDRSDVSSAISMPEVRVQTTADSLALIAYNAAGGVEMWSGDHVPFLQFSFGSGEAPTRRRHLWNRTTGDYRLERPVSADTTITFLFNVNTKTGKAYINESAVPDSMNAAMIERAHRTFVNDSYWLLLPTKLFDEGVQRTYVADSSDSATGVLRLTFEGVGYTPDDNYWIWIDRQSGKIDKWIYMLQGRPTMGSRTWEDYVDFEVDGMIASLAERKVSLNGSSSLYTSPIDLPDQVSPELFSSPAGTLAKTNTPSP